MSSSSPVHLYAIPRSLCFLPPVYSLILVLRSAPIPSPLSRFNISLLALISLVTAALGLAEVFLTSFPCAVAYTILLASLRFQLCLSVLYLVIVSVPADAISPFRLAFYTAVLGLLLFSAAILALIPPFLPPKGFVYSSSIPQLLPPLLDILFVTLSLPLISYLLLAASSAPIHTLPRLRPIRSLPSPVTSTPPSPSSHRKTVSLDLSPTFSQVQLIDAGVRSSLPKQTLSRLLLVGQVFSLFSSVFNICDVALVNGPFIANLGLQTIEAAFFVAWIICVMMASSFCRSAPRTTPTISSPATPLTELPARVHPRSRTLSSGSSVARTSVQHAPPPYRPHLRPTLRILTTNLQNRTSCLRKPKGSDTPLGTEDEIDDPLGTLTADPFAPPELGAKVRESVPEHTIYQPPQTRMSAWGTLTLPVPPTMPAQPLRSKKQPSPSVSPSSNMDLEYEQIHREEALLAQRLLRRLENGVGYLTGRKSPGSLGRKSRG